MSNYRDDDQSILPDTLPNGLRDNYRADSFR